MEKTTMGVTATANPDIYFTVYEGIKALTKSNNVPTDPRIPNLSNQTISVQPFL